MFSARPVVSMERWSASCWNSRSTATPTAGSISLTAAIPPPPSAWKHMVKAVFDGAKVDVSECGGLCSYYAELGGLLVGYEDAEA